MSDMIDQVLSSGEPVDGVWRDWNLLSLGEGEDSKEETRNLLRKEDEERRRGKEKEKDEQSDDEDDVYNS